METAMTKMFDALEMSRRLREQTSRKLATLTSEQRIALLNAHITAAGSKPARSEKIRA